MKRPVDALSRRGLMAAGAGAGALAAFAQFLPATRSPAPGAQPAAAAGQASGYRLTEHVKRYYRTTLV